ncbi:hypothetical protein CR205_11010 [Alteribacter lacisalsi]|uniref:YpjP family protein n=1 Tax=Alteribacter lacisalsi TaxID=2045244 RepID=A0A2W0HQB1_9BACI|nr:YpjP family protein [Alteribacter lacisalsi]PYZ99059.1 hypothetical protein CR205_11010 [Alteribacter lacisalsi]
MKLWFKKLSIIMITFITMGAFIPPTYLDANADTGEAFPPDDDDLNGLDEGGLSDDDENIDLDENLTDIESLDDVIDRITEEAREHTLRKLGPKISRQIENEVMSAIMPNMEDVLNTIIEEAGDDQRYTGFTVSEEPSAGYGERIFNIYDSEAEEEVAKFHVRRDNRPRDGYWFNFHYHLSSDGFEEHHQLGEVYWDKNTPPKWMSK